MKIIEAIIKSARLGEVQSALRKIGLTGISVNLADGCSGLKDHTGIYRGQVYAVDTLPDIKVELAVDDERADAAVAAIVSAAEKVRLTVTDVEELSQEEPQVGIYRGQEYLVATPTESKIELVVDDTRADHAVAAMIVMTPNGVRMTVGDEKEFGRQTPRMGIYRGREYPVSVASESKSELDAAA